MSHAVRGALEISMVTLLAAGLAITPGVAAPQGFYVAVAPYVSSTHPCTYHVKGSCQAELKETVLRFWLRSTDGAVNRSGTVRTLADGFVEWWLPHDKTYVVTFAYQGRRGTGRFTSFAKDPTCITSIRLK